MTGEQYAAALRRLHLTPYAAASYLGLSVRQSLRYAAEGHIPEPIRRLILLLSRYGLPRDF